MTDSSNRIAYFDAAKGLGMLLVVCGHSLSDGTLNNWIHSFHVPLFFLISGFFIKPEASLSVIVSKLWYNILRPLIVTHLFCFILLGIIFYISSGLFPYHREWIMGQFLGLTKYQIPVIWFLYALFWGRILSFLLIKYFKRFHLIASLFLFGVSFLLSKSWPADNVPLFLLQGLSAAVFIDLGYEVKVRGMIDINCSKQDLILGLSFLAFAASAPVYMSRVFFPLGLWNVVISSFLSLVVILGLKLLEQRRNNCLTKALWSFICHIGQYSLLILCMHCIEMTLQVNRWLALLIDSAVFVIVIKLLVLSLLPIIVLHIPVLKSVYIHEKR